MRFLTKFVLALVLPAFVPPEPYPPLATVSYGQGTSTWQACPRPRVIDGDTIRCGRERVRLLGIDAPELHGCPRYRRCAPGDPVASTDALRLAIRGQPVRYMTVKYDHYGRAVAVVTAGGVNLSCSQLAHRRAVYVERWDDGHLVGQACR